MDHGSLIGCTKKQEKAVPSHLLVISSTVRSGRYRPLRSSLWISWVPISRRQMCCTWLPFRSSLEESTKTETPLGSRAITGDRSPKHHTNTQRIPASDASFPTLINESFVQYFERLPLVGPSSLTYGTLQKSPNTIDPLRGGPASLHPPVSHEASMKPRSAWKHRSGRAWEREGQLP